jgi:hypothetical protein
MAPDTGKHKEERRRKESSKAGRKEGRTEGGGREEGRQEGRDEGERAWWTLLQNSRSVIVHGRWWWPWKAAIWPPKKGVEPLP